MYLHYLLLIVAPVVRCLHEVDVETNGKADQILDRNGVCHIIDEYWIDCTLSEGGKLPSLQVTYDQNGYPKEWPMIRFSCNESLSHDMFNILLTSSIFGDKFWVSRYYFDFKYCNFIWSTDDLFCNIGLYLEYQLLDRSFYVGNLRFPNCPFDLTFLYDNSDGFEMLYPYLQGSPVVQFTLYRQYSSIPPEVITNMPNLTKIEVIVRGTLVVRSRAFWRLHDHIEISMSPDGGYVSLENKAISEIAIIDLLAIPVSRESSTLKRVEIGAFDSTTHISNMSLHVLHDAFQGPIFSDVSHVGHLQLTISPSNSNCTFIRCMVNIDFGETKVDRLDLIMLETTFVLQSNRSLSQIGTLGVSLELCDYVKAYFWGDPWVEAANIHGIIEGAKAVELNVGYHKYNVIYPGQIRGCSPAQAFFLPINLTDTVLESVNLTTSDVRYYPNPICESSWLTIPRSMKLLKFRLHYPRGYVDGSNPYPLIIRSPIISNRTTFGSSEYYTHIVDCECSIAWLKQVIDCPTGVKLSNKWLEYKCSFDGQTTVEQFLNSTRCCTSTEPPTTNNEPNMPLDCDKFLRIPPELLYFKHTDLPQCRESRDWEWDPCDVLAFYNGFASTTETTNPTIATTTNPTTVTFTSTVTMYQWICINNKINESNHCYHNKANNCRINFYRCQHHSCAMDQNTFVR